MAAGRSPGWWLRAALVVALVAAAWRIEACGGAVAAAAPGFCGGKCAARCGRARGPCVRSCVLCCGECSCVPTAARGAARVDDCPCYRDMLTAGPRKRPKCP